MDTFFKVMGSIYIPSRRENAVPTIDILPAGNYSVKCNPALGYFLEKTDSFKMPEKLYGKTYHHVVRILNTFEQRSNNTGVLLTGMKGTGKSMTARSISCLAAELDIPTLIVSEPHCGDTFFAFLSSIQQKTVILLDEYEKMYDSEDQQKMLSLLDGMYPSKKLFVLTANYVNRMDEHMMNRPGRIYYRLDFEGLALEVVAEFCRDNLVDKTMTKEVVKVCTIFRKQMNFDMLQALVSEMNLYKEGPEKSLEMLNVRPPTSYGGKYTISVTIDNQTFSNKELQDSDWNGNAFSIGYLEVGIERKAFVAKLGEEAIKKLEYGENPKNGKNSKPDNILKNLRKLSDLSNYDPKEYGTQPVTGDGSTQMNEAFRKEYEEEDKEEAGYVTLDFEPEHFQSASAAAGIFIYKNEHGHVLTLTEKRKENVGHYDMISKFAD